MAKLTLNEMFRPASLVLAIVSASALSGCVTADMALDDSFVPYTVDARYPLATANGRAVRKPCGKWTSNLGDTSRNERFTNHGCAVRANMAAMIANPHDIDEPHAISLPPAAGAVAAVKTISNGQTAGNNRSFFSFF